MAMRLPSINTGAIWSTFERLRASAARSSLIGPLLARNEAIQGAAVIDVDVREQLVEVHVSRDDHIAVLQQQRDQLASAIEAGKQVYREEKEKA